MKKVIITNYIHGLASFLDEQKIKWEHIDKDSIIIHYKTDEQLFKIGFEFGKFYISTQG